MTSYSKYSAQYFTLKMYLLFINNERVGLSPKCNSGCLKKSLMCEYTPGSWWYQALRKCSSQTEKLISRLALWSIEINIHGIILYLILPLKRIVKSWLLDHAWFSHLIGYVLWSFWSWFGPQLNKTHLLGDNSFCKLSHYSNKCIDE